MKTSPPSKDTRAILKSKIQTATLEFLEESGSPVTVITIRYDEEGNAEIDDHNLTAGGTIGVEDGVLVLRLPLVPPAVGSGVILLPEHG